MKAKAALIAVIIIVVVIVALLLLRSNGQPEGNIILTDGLVLDDSVCSKLGKVSLIHQTGCPYCEIAISRLEELEEELKMEFDYYNLAIDLEKEEILSRKLIPQGVPTAIINCKVYVGARSKEVYKEAILG